MSLRLIDAYPSTALTAPNASVTLELELHNTGELRKGTLTAELRDRTQVVARKSQSVNVAAEHQRLFITLPTPPEEARGYEARLELTAGDTTLEVRTAVLVANHWWQAPRYGFLSEFPPGEPAPERVRELAKFHINVVQFYDWMYRHYRFLPPNDLFQDAMGRELSLETVRERVRACHGANMAALAYGAVYGAEPECTNDHPDWVLRDAQGEKLSLIDLFFITDLRPGAPWRELILQEFEGAVREIGFDGIHMDQYGFPKWSYDVDGNPVNLAEHFPGLINEASWRVAQQREGAAVLFNAVNNWPLEQVVEADQAAVYIEVWPPHDHYRDLVDLVQRARDLSGKQVILAAYLEPFRDGGETAEYAALLATAVIGSAGGFHLLLGEGSAVLRDPYYPNHGLMQPEFARTMRRHYDHTAANHHYLFAADLQDVTTSFTTGINTEVVLTGAPVSVEPDSGKVWMVVKQRANQLVINLVNLVGTENTKWNEDKHEPVELEDLILSFSRHFKIKRVTWSSPDDQQVCCELPLLQAESGVNVRLPKLKIWATLLVEIV